MTGTGRRWILIGVIWAALALGYQGVRWTLEPRADPSTQPPVRTVDVPEGTSFHQVALMLDREGLIHGPRWFQLLGKITFADRRIQPGEYAFHAAMPPTEILSRLRSGDVVLHQVTIPEGFSLVQIAGRLAELELVHKDEFLRLTGDPEFIRTLALDAPSLEGYLFPTTYHFPKYRRSEEIIRTMVAFTWKAFTPVLRLRAEQLGLSIHDVLTLASVIEKETGVADERALISAVFHNRLRRGIPLQSDPTVIYGLKAFDGNLRKRDLSSKSPYNTYQIRGLPPGPIANPGADAIHATLYPAKSSYLYFVSRNDGTHHFSSTFAEHNRAVDKYQRRASRRSS